ncbi:hypothetical protein ACQPZF_27090 [Actinosynnema sp. CS-041913]|uniref:hypothetical protein n=1 Tax=Actinosynnema sp. CS-041913 TaxID=3239917 RepID=UPI003D8AEBAD
MTYQSQRFDFVAAGIPAVNRLARPAVRDLGLADWVQAKSREHGLEVRVSDAGQRSALLARMLGGRRQFLDLFAGPFLGALHGMRPTSATSSHAYPHRDGVALSSEQGVLTFGGLCARMPDTSREQARALADTALRAGVLRRGLVLGCAVCEEVQFQPLERLGQTWTCLRCGATGQLDLAAWRMPVDVPTWFYDLHPVARHFLRDHGEVSVLLSAHLASQTPRLPKAVFQDVEELEFALQGTPRVEVDLITYNDDILTVAECKSTDHLAGGKAKGQAEVAKKCQAVEWLQADRLLFATTALTWSEATRNVIRGGVATYPWGPLGAPEVRLVTGLGTPEVLDERLL